MERINQLIFLAYLCIIGEVTSGLVGMGIAYAAVTREAVFGVFF
jgi:hypothetical protein